MDDCIVTNAGDYIYLVINAGHEEKDLPHMEAILADFKAKGGDASIEVKGDGRGGGGGMDDCFTGKVCRIS